MQEALQGLKEVKALRVAHDPEGAAAQESPEVAGRRRQNGIPAARTVIRQLSLSEPAIADWPAAHILRPNTTSGQCSGCGVSAAWTRHPITSH